MTTIITRLTVAPDGHVSVATPLPPGDHAITIEIADHPPVQNPTEPFDVGKLPALDVGSWREGATFSREEIYGDRGR